MPPTIIGALAQVIIDGPEGMRPEYITIMGINPTDPAGPPLIPERTLQFWPSQIQDSIAIGWSKKEIPGASHALMQWGGNSGRTISFEVVVGRFMKDVKDWNIVDKLFDPFKLNTPTSKTMKDNREYNEDVVAAIKYFRAFTYPSYQPDEAGFEVSYNPPVAILHLPGMGLGDISSGAGIAPEGPDVFFGVMTTCDYSIEHAFPNGVPKLARLSLAFEQVVQDPFGNKGVVFRSASDLLDVGAGRSIVGGINYRGGGHPPRMLR